MNLKYGSLIVAILLVASTFAFLPSVAAYSPSTNIQIVPDWNVTLPGGNGGHNGGGGGHNGGGSSSFSCPTITGADHSVCSTNWSGYAVNVTSVTSVSGSWKVPTLSCSHHGTSYVAIWVGIDGFSSSTVEQTGILGVCNNGAASYSAWYEFYPNPMVTISNVVVKSGDSISASVSYSSGGFVATLSDTTSKQSYSTSTVSVSGAQGTSAEWVVERPALCTVVVCKLSTLASFAPTQFTSSLATIGGASKSISGFGSDVAITMVGGTSGPVLAEPTSLASSGSSFTVNYG